MKKLKSLITSRRFQFAVVGVLTVVSDGFGWGLTELQMGGIVAIVVTWIAGDAYRKTE